MKDIKEILRKMNIADDYRIEKVFNEAEDYYYEDVYNVYCKENHYILKKTNQTELSFYLLNSDYLPKLISYVKEDNIYILIEYIEGNPLYKMDKEVIGNAVKRIADFQLEYMNKKLNIESDFDKSVYNRKNYLEDSVFEKEYDEFLKIYESIPRTINNGDLLPFNLIKSNKDIYFIDFVEGGYLPYPLMFTRFIAFAYEDNNHIFYLKEEDKHYAINLYYDLYASKIGIAKKDYLKTIYYFLFYEYCEWIMVYNQNKNNLSPFLINNYNKSYQEALKVLDKIRNI